MADITVGRQMPRPITPAAISTACCTSLTAVLYNRSHGTLPLSILQATRLTGSSHSDVVSPDEEAAGAVVVQVFGVL